MQMKTEFESSVDYFFPLLLAAEFLFTFLLLCIHFNSLHFKYYLTNFYSLCVCVALIRLLIILKLTFLFQFQYYCEKRRKRTEFELPFYQKNKQKKNNKEWHGILLAVFSIFYSKFKPKSLQRYRHRTTKPMTRLMIVAFTLHYSNDSTTIHYLQEFYNCIRNIPLIHLYNLQVSFDIIFVLIICPAAEK